MIKIGSSRTQERRSQGKVLLKATLEDKKTREGKDRRLQKELFQEEKYRNVAQV